MALLRTFPVSPSCPPPSFSAEKDLMFVPGSGIWNTLWNKQFVQQESGQVTKEPAAGTSYLEEEEVAGEFGQECSLYF